MYIFIFMFALRDPNWKCRRFIRFFLCLCLSPSPWILSLSSHTLTTLFILFYFIYFFRSGSFFMLHIIWFMYVRGRNILQMFTVRYAHLLSFASRLLWFDYFRLDSTALVHLTLCHITSTKCKFSFFANKHIHTIFTCASVCTWLNGKTIGKWKIKFHTDTHKRSQTINTKKKAW